MWPEVNMDEFFEKYCPADSINPARLLVLHHVPEPVAGFAAVWLVNQPEESDLDATVVAEVAGKDHVSGQTFKNIGNAFATV